MYRPSCASLIHLRKRLAHRGTIVDAGQYAETDGGLEL
jgi:hypothetical protein